MTRSRASQTDRQAVRNASIPPSTIIKGDSEKALEKRAQECITMSREIIGELIRVNSGIKLELFYISHGVTFPGISEEKVSATHQEVEEQLKRARKVKKSLREHLEKHTLNELIVKINEDIIKKITEDAKKTVIAGRYDFLDMLRLNGVGDFFIERFRERENNGLLFNFEGFIDEY